MTLEASQSPVERMANAHADHRAKVAASLIERIRTCHPTFFEELVLKVLVAMGYGGSEEEASEHLGRSGDGGVDGVINEDSLGLDRVYVQAKRWTENPVRRPDVQAFVGALEGRGAMKGVFITASHFTSEAVDYAERLARRVVLIDGQLLAELMMRFGVGVTTRETFAIQEVDEDFFFSELG
jgi:restriction system protein